MTYKEMIYQPRVAAMSKVTLSNRKGIYLLFLTQTEMFWSFGGEMLLVDGLQLPLLLNLPKRRVCT